jgi:hypothetical protein
MTLDVLTSLVIGFAPDALVTEREVPSDLLMVRSLVGDGVFSAVETDRRV